MATPVIQIDPNTGERINTASSTQSRPQIDPATGERVPQSAVGTVIPPPPTTPQPSIWAQIKSNWQSNTQPQDTGHPLIDAVHNIGGRAAQNLVSPVLHPIDTAKGLLGTMTQSPWLTALQATKGYMDSGHPLENVAGDTIGSLLQGGLIGAGTAASPGVGRGLDNFRQWARPISSEGIVPPTETAARRLTQTIIPANKDATSFIAAAQSEVPNIRAFAARTNNPLNTQLEFSKAAAGHAGEVSDFYKNQILGPNDRSVDTTGTGFGRRTGEGPATSARLSDIDQRISDINQQLSPAYGKLNAGDTREALASKTSLQNEAAGLRTILNNELAKSTGLTPDQISDIRQRVGKSYELANDTDAAVTGRMQGEGRADLGSVTLSHIPGQFLEFLRGGPTQISDRAFRRVISGYPGDPRPLPEINPPSPSPSGIARTPAWASKPIMTGQPEVQPIIPDIDGARALMGQRIGDRIAQRGLIADQNAQQASQNRDLASQEFLHSHALDQAAQDASQGRSQQAGRIRDLIRQSDQDISKGFGDAMRRKARENAASRDN